jgi:hypothetical protein
MTEVLPFKEEKIDPFMPPPTGTHTISDFKIISHVTLKVPKKATGSSKKLVSL